jgi:hypothetical protein
MSAQANHLGSVIYPHLIDIDRMNGNKSDDNYAISNRIHLEALYQMCFAPEPTREQIAREQFLLECD